MLLVRHGEAVEADLLVRGIDLLDLYREDKPLTLRRVWVLIEQLLLQRGTALMVSIAGDRGAWSRLDEMVAGFLGVKPPEDKAVTDWKAANQARIRRMREERARSAAAAAPPVAEGSAEVAGETERSLQDDERE